MIECDVCVVGAGIAGASVAALLAADRRVALVEREAHPGHHTTGRSVAIFSESVSGAQITPLTRASRAFFAAPPERFSETPLLRPRPVLTFGREDQRASLEAQFEALSPESGRRWLDAAEACALAPILRPDQAQIAFLEPGAFDMDVDALHQGWLRTLRRAGGELLVNAPVTAAEPDGRGWRVQAGEREIFAGVLVDAAGAWADELAELAGVRPLGFEPRRRTIAVLAADGWAVDPWPMCVDADHALYFKPDAGRLLVSAMDQTPSPPCDAFADDMDVAVALDRFQAAVDLPLRKPLRTWAGLRTFAPDGEPVAGFDVGQPAFFWLAGQGGAGIQTCPALAHAAASLVRGQAIPGDLAGFGVSAAALSPARFSPAAH
jgi:D-arginine dehydrogenase